MTEPLPSAYIERARLKPRSRGVFAYGRSFPAQVLCFRNPDFSLRGVKTVSSPLQTALIALVPACMLLLGSTALLIYTRIRLSAVLQVLGATGIVMVVLTHICEALGLFPEMGWGTGNSVGHYLNFGGTVCGLTLFPIGYLLYALTPRGR